MTCRWPPGKLSRLVSHHSIKSCAMLTVVISVWFRSTKAYLLDCEQCRLFSSCPRALASVITRCRKSGEVEQPPSAISKTESYTRILGNGSFLGKETYLYLVGHDVVLCNHLLDNMLDCCHTANVIMLAWRRAYKLGKGQWSYNRCSLTLRQDVIDVSGSNSTASSLSVTKATVHVDSEQNHRPHDQVGDFRQAVCMRCDITSSVCNNCEQLVTQPLLPDPDAPVHLRWNAQLAVSHQF